jgi:hypothetical protein
MKKLKLTVGLVLAVCSLGATAASAMAHEFKDTASKFPAAFTANAGNSGGFVFNEVSFSCSGPETGEGKAEAMLFQNLRFSQHLTGCAIAGLGSMTVTPWEIEANANGTVAVVNTATITMFGSCKITIGPTGNAALKNVSYANSGAEVDIEQVLAGITYTANEACAEFPGIASGKTGRFHISEQARSTAGGILSWK